MADRITEASDNEGEEGYTAHAWMRSRNRYSTGAYSDDANTPSRGTQSARAFSPVDTIQQAHSTTVFVDTKGASCAQRRARDLRRQTLQGHYSQGRRTNHDSHLLANSAGGAVPARLSLDSQRTEMSSQHGEPDRYAMEGYVGDLDGRRSPWSGGQMRRARRYSVMTHSRGVSCPTLNITRIMRSISVSSGSHHAPLSATPNRAASKQSKRASLRSSVFAYEAGSARQAVSAVRFSPMSSSPLLPMSSVSEGGGLASARSSLEAATVHATLREGMPASSRGSSTSSVYGTLEEHQPPLVKHRYSHQSQNDTPVASTASMPLSSADLPLAEAIYTDGLRRRLSARRHGTDTPDIAVQDNITSPLSPPLSEVTEFGSAVSQDQRLLLPRRPSAAQSTSSGSSARWSTVSAESPHKRYSYSAAAIAEALRQLQSAANHDSLAGDSIAQATSPSKGSEETMTITLKGPRKREGGESSSENDEQTGRAAHIEGSGVGEQLGDIRSPRRSEEGEHRAPSDGEVAVPAVYLDGAASLWDQYVAELESSELDPNIHLKRLRVSQFLHVPWNVERLLWFGVAICFDALIYVFSVLPAKFVRALVHLLVAMAHEVPAAVECAATSPYAKALLAALPETWQLRVSRLGRRAQSEYVRLTRRTGGDSSSDAALAAGPRQRGHVTRWLSPTQLFDLYRGLLIIVACLVLCRIDAAQMYHSIRAQSSLKLYFIFSALDIFDRLLSSFGHDVLDALQSTVTDPRSKRWRTGAAYFALAQCYMLVHTLVLFYQVITLNVAVNAYSDQLLSLLISNQFVEIKSNVFKKWEKEMLFQVACADIVERFQQIVFLFIIILRNLAELSGTGFSPLFAASPSPAGGSTASSAAPSSSFAAGTVLPNAQPPVSFDSATPSAFGPLLPVWVSMPVVNRIVTPMLMVLGSEILIDWIKHAFITKLNWIRPEIYSHYIDILSRDLACSRSGTAARAVPATAAASEALSAAAAQTDAGTGSGQGDIAEAVCEGKKGDSVETAKAPSSLDSQGEARAQSRPASSSASALTHVVLKALAWAGASLLPRSSDPTTEAADNGSGGSSQQKRRHTHRRAQSVTQPQLFVDQSSRVARRLGLSPMPLACLIMLMLMQVLHILASSSRSHRVVIQATQPPEHTADQLNSTLSSLGWLFAIPLLGPLARIASAALGMLGKVVSLNALVYAGYVILHPHALFSWIWSLPSQQQPSPPPAAAHACHQVTASLGWTILDIVGWLVILLIAYALIVWVKLAFANRLMHFAWTRYRAYERRTEECKGTEKDTSNLKQFNDSTRKLDRDQFAEVGKLIGREKSEAEWDKQRPKWTLDNIERYSLFKSRVP